MRAAARVLAWLLGLAALLGMAVWWFLIPHPKHFAAGTGRQAADTDFTASRCKEQADEPGSTFRGGVRATEWAEDGSLRILAGVATNCEAPFAYGGYKLAGNDLTLEYAIAWEKMRAMCTCGYELTYRIKGLKRQDYKIALKEI